MRNVLFALLFCLPPLHAAELTLDLPGGSRTWETGALLAHPQARDLTIPDDVSYKKTMRYRAVPLAALLEGVTPEQHLQAVALDGFAAELTAAPLLAKQGSRAWLAIEDPASPWPPLAAGKPGAGPFYLVWTDPEAARIGPEQWPFQVARIRYLPSVAERFPALLPAKDASVEVKAGFAQFQKNCLACHRLNGAGDAQFGPDLNIPHNPTEYLAGNFLPRYIRDPQSLRRWPEGKMPGFSKQAISDEELGQLIGYLKHMAGRKVAP
ncbi:cytochrome c [Metapseudomonas lalkuanensis]|uniref:Cytochrome c n=1 Tax=Metapseudomonas lalkuanensis TaxID=2604832 RepID=A0A5J6QQP7_9GAMM|nr:cytochrome c [Pseudomonas lalkuanensis]QEY63691.1 cytochrome c [Pseudomonas lalkuanensis]